MALYKLPFPSFFFGEAKDDVIRLALSIESSKNALLENCRFLQLACESLTHSMPAHV